MYISTPPSPEGENFQKKIYYPAGDRTSDPLNQRQTCYHLSQRALYSVHWCYIGETCHSLSDHMNGHHFTPHYRTQSCQLPFTHNPTRSLSKNADLLSSLYTFKYGFQYNISQEKLSKIGHSFSIWKKVWLNLTTIRYKMEDKQIA